MLRALAFIATLFVASSVATLVSAYESVCSDPHRARVLGRMTLRIREGDEPAFAQRMRTFLQASEMSLGEVSGGDGTVWTNRTIIFQSPQVSVAIFVDTRRNSDVARIRVERTCITDDLEPWRPYWSDFRAFVDRTFPD